MQEKNDALKKKNAIKAAKLKADQTKAAKGKASALATTKKKKKVGVVKPRIKKSKPPPSPETGSSPSWRLVQHRAWGWGGVDRPKVVLLLQHVPRI